MGTKKANKKSLSLGLITGFANGVFGSGGGMIAVPMLARSGLGTKKTHATSLALILPLSIVSTILYAKNGAIMWTDAISLVPFGLAGAILGGALMKKIKSIWLKRFFGLIMIIAGVKAIFS